MFAVQTTAILVAAGLGTRLAASEPKAFVAVAGVPLFIHALRALVAAPAVSAAIVVVPPGERSRGLQLIRGSAPWRCPVSLVEGGAERQDSVRAGLEGADGADFVAIHDAARPFVSPEVVGLVVAAAIQYGAAIAAAPATETVKQVHPEGWIENTLPRERVWLAQTPQVFRADLIRTAHARAASGDPPATDDAMLVERLGVRVHVVRANPENWKITTAEDLRWAEWRLATAEAPR